MITSDGWFDWMERIPGPADKVNSGTNTAKIYLPHSAVGYYGGWSARLFSQERRPDGRYTAYAAASVHGWISYSGHCIQHYPVSASCWASGSAFPNLNGIAFENEGGYQPENEPLRPGQINANVRILMDLAAWKGVQPSYWRRPGSDNDMSATLYEHRECVRFGSAPTACPSNRIPWAAILEQLNPVIAPPEPTGPTQPTEVVALRSLVRAGTVIAAGDQSLGDLGEEDKNALRWIAEQL